MKIPLYLEHFPSFTVFPYFIFMELYSVMRGKSQRNSLLPWRSGQPAPIMGSFEVLGVRCSQHTVLSTPTVWLVVEKSRIFFRINSLLSRPYLTDVICKRLGIF